MDYKTFMIKKDKHHRDDGYIYPFFEKEDKDSMITIICPEHGEFRQNIYAHLKGQGCPKCAKNQKWDTETYIKALNEKFGEGRYDTSECVYVNKRTKVTLYCHEKFADGTEHGKIEVLPMSFLRTKHGCKYCALGIDIKKDSPRQQKPLECSEKTIEKGKNVIKRANEIFDNFYSYNNFVYRGSLVKSAITCPIHGDFEMTPNNHLRGHGCPQCAGNMKLNVETFKKEASIKHNNKYDYKLIKQFTNSNSIVTPICPEHGIFEVSVSNHLRGVGCSACSENRKRTTETFIDESREVHGNRYNYRNTIYVNWRTEVAVGCLVHGEFFIRPDVHLRGGGCPICNQSHLEEEIMLFLNENDILFEQQKRFEWLGLQSLDFFIPSLNIGIECQGTQHFRPIGHFGGNDCFDTILERDIRKYKLCTQNGIKLLYFWKDNFMEYEDVKFGSIYSNNNIYFNTNDLLTYLEQCK